LEAELSGLEAWVSLMGFADGIFFEAGALGGGYYIHTKTFAMFAEVRGEPLASGRMVWAVRFGTIKEGICVDVGIGEAPIEFDELVAVILADVDWAEQQIIGLGAEVVFGVGKAEPIGLVLVATHEKDGADEVGEGDGAEEAFDGAKVGFFVGMAQAEDGTAGTVD
jgi:hypothetical protein